MKQNQDNGKYVLENQLRTWSEMKRKAAAAPSASSTTVPQSPAIPTRRWGGCAEGCNHDHSQYPRRNKRSNTIDDMLLPPAAQPAKDDHPDALAQGLDGSIVKDSRPRPDSTQKSSTNKTDTHLAGGSGAPLLELPLQSPALAQFKHGRDFGGSLSGAATPAEGLSDSQEYFNEGDVEQAVKKEKRMPKRRPTEQDISNWAQQSGMGTGARAERLGDEAHDEDADEEEDAQSPEDEFEAIKKKQELDQSVQGSVY